MISILIADDQAMIRSGFRMILEAEDDMKVVGEAEDGVAAIEIARRERPDIVLMDIRMPRLDGIEATRQVVDLKGPRVVILTTFDLDEYLFSSIRAGASGFMLKDAPAQDLVDAIRVVAGGEALIEPRMTTRLLREFARQPDPAKAQVPKQFSELTPREKEVFQAVASGMSNQEIAQLLFISETTVKTHVAHVLTKLGMRDRIQAVVFAYEHGLTGEETDG